MIAPLIDRLRAHNTQEARLAVRCLQEAEGWIRQVDPKLLDSAEECGAGITSGTLASSPGWPNYSRVLGRSPWMDLVDMGRYRPDPRTEMATTAGPGEPTRYMPRTEEEVV